MSIEKSSGYFCIANGLWVVTKKVFQTIIVVFPFLQG